MNVNVTRDVISDLLPLYVSGEASEDTRTLVDSFLSQDAELARLVRDRAEQLLSAEPPQTADKEEAMKTIERTKALVKRRSALLSCGLLFSLLPAAFAFDANGMRWIWADAPVGAILVAILGLASWAGYFATKYRLRATGL